MCTATALLSRVQIELALTTAGLSVSERGRLGIEAKDTDVVCNVSFFPFSQSDQAVSRVSVRVYAAHPRRALVFVDGVTTTSAIVAAVLEARMVLND